MEEPFTILPMQAFCDKIYNWCTEIMTWYPGDDGQEDDRPAIVAEEAVKDLNLDAEIEKVEDIQKIMNAGVMMTPAFAVDGEVKSVGKVLSVDEIKKILA